MYGHWVRLRNGLWFRCRLDRRCNRTSIAFGFMFDREGGRYSLQRFDLGQIGVEPLDIFGIPSLQRGAPAFQLFFC
jgi:hypothetical protein